LILHPDPFPLQLLKAILQLGQVFVGMMVVLDLQVSPPMLHLIVALLVVGCVGMQVLECTRLAVPTRVESLQFLAMPPFGSLPITLILGIRMPLAQALPDQALLESLVQWVLAQAKNLSLNNPYFLRKNDHEALSSFCIHPWHDCNPRLWF
jgi:hypothetical protein